MDENSVHAQHSYESEKLRLIASAASTFDVRKETNIAFGVLCDRYLKEHVVLHKKARLYLRNEASTKVLKAFFGETTPSETDTTR